MFGRIGVGELVLILAVALVIFGPSKLPEIGKVLGDAVRNFKKHSERLGEELGASTAEPRTTPVPEQAKPIAEGPKPVGVTLAADKETVRETQETKKI